MDKHNDYRMALASLHVDALLREVRENAEAARNSGSLEAQLDYAERAKIAAEIAVERLAFLRDAGASSEGPFHPLRVRETHGG